MTNEAKYLWFRSQIGKMNPTEKMFLMNRICNTIHYKIHESPFYFDRIAYKSMLKHFSVNIRNLDEIWWIQLRNHRSLYLFREIVNEL